ncbi:MAG: SoxR reducing system RseC family protein [Gammaproteobacteria bacterium]|nr:SoxR reducing system RseC family protein [Gammaproteobacteria bacterium]
MIEEQAIVSGLEGDLAIIRMQRQNACSHCELNKGCGTGAIGRLLGHRSKPLAIRNDYDLKAGDRVLVGLPDRAFLNASLLIYGLPLVALIGGGLIAQWAFAGSELSVFIFSTAGFFAGLWFSGQIAKNHFSQQFNPRILEVGSEPID